MKNTAFEKLLESNEVYRDVLGKWGAEITRNLISKELKANSEYTAMAICDLVDEIELDCKNTSMEEWKLFKKIRNTIRNKFVLKT